MLKLFFGKPADYLQLLFSFSCSLGLHACIIVLMCFLSLDQFPVAYHMLTYSVNQMLYKQEPTMGPGVIEENSVHDAQDEEPELPSLSQNTHDETDHAELDGDLPDDLIELFAQWNIFPKTQSIEKNNAPVTKPTVPAAQPKAEKKKPQVKKETPKKAPPKDIKKAEPQLAQKPITKEVKAEKPAQPKSEPAHVKAASQKPLTAAAQPQKKKVLASTKPVVKQETPKKVPAPHVQTVTKQALPAPVSGQSLPRAAQATTVLGEVGPGFGGMSTQASRVSLEFTDRLPLQTIFSSDEYDAITHELYETIKQAWEPLAGWEEAGPVIISVEADLANGAAEPRFVMKSYAAAKNQQAMSLARYIVKTGKAKGRTFNLTFK